MNKFKEVGRGSPLSTSVNRSEELLKVNKFEQIWEGVDWGPYVGKGRGFWGCPQSELRMRA